MPPRRKEDCPPNKPVYVQGYCRKKPRNLPGGRGVFGQAAAENLFAPGNQAAAQGAAPGNQAAAQGARGQAAAQDPFRPSKEELDCLYQRSGGDVYKFNLGLAMWDANRLYKENKKLSADLAKMKAQEKNKRRN